MRTPLGSVKPFSFGVRRGDRSTRSGRRQGDQLVGCAAALGAGQRPSSTAEGCANKTWSAQWSSKPIRAAGRGPRRRARLARRGLLLRFAPPRKARERPSSRCRSGASRKPVAASSDEDRRDGGRRHGCNGPAGHSGLAVNIQSTYSQHTVNIHSTPQSTSRVLMRKPV